MYKLLYDRFDYLAGTIVYDFLGCDYGCKAEDEYMTGCKHLVVTTSPDGSGPFFTVPAKHLAIQVTY